MALTTPELSGVLNPTLRIVLVVHDTALPVPLTVHGFADEFRPVSISDAPHHRVITGEVMRLCLPAVVAILSSPHKSVSSDPPAGPWPATECNRHEARGRGQGAETAVRWRLA